VKTAGIGIAPQSHLYSYEKAPYAEDMPNKITASCRLSPSHTMLIAGVMAIESSK
jgi:hypothetical protein